jgi:hypothetical protein
MSHETVANGHAHIHYDRPAAATPSPDPLDAAAKEHYGASTNEVGRRTDVAERAAYDGFGAVLGVLRSYVERKTGETDERIVKYAIAQALVRLGAAGQFALMTQDLDASTAFGREVQHLVIRHALAEAGF